MKATNQPNTVIATKREISELLKRVSNQPDHSYVRSIDSSVQIFVLKKVLRNGKFILEHAFGLEISTSNITLDQD